MANKKQGGGDEPSMEEILSSIRQIISDDTAASGSDGESAAEQPAEHDDDDVLELTEEVEEEDSPEPENDQTDEEAEEGEFFLDPSDDRPAPDFGQPDEEEDSGLDQASVEPEPEPGAFSDPFAAMEASALMEEPEPDPEPEPEPETFAAPTRASASASQFGNDDDTWISSEPAEQTTASLQQLAEASRKEEFGQGPRSESDRILENMVREALRPQVKAWLDDNLPGLVERIVREEVRRMTRKAEATADPGDEEDAY